MPKIETKTKSEKQQHIAQPRLHALLAFFVVLGLGAIMSWFAVGVLWAALRTGDLGLTTPEQDAALDDPSITLHEPTVYSRLLDGVLVGSLEEADPFPVGMMIENLSSTRPQSGLSGASVVYEAVAEGGATRFLAVYAGPGDHLAKIGPVRSARPYYLEWFSEYRGLYGHAGGSPDALRMISGFGIHDLNGIGREGKYFWRDRGIAAPHNLFTSSELLSRALRDLQFEGTASGITPWTFKDDLALDARPPSGHAVTIKFSGAAYEVEYRYDQATNRYLRFNAGVVHTDTQTNEQLTATNVIVQVVPPILDIGEKGRLTMDVHGKGVAYLFVDGGVNVGTWTKATREDRTRFFYENGEEVLLNRGSTWVAVLPSDQAVEYTLW